MLHLPPRWEDLPPDVTVRAIGEIARTRGAYPALAAGLTFAYLARCVGSSALVERRPERLFRDSMIFRVRDFEWRVLDDGDDQSCEWAAKALDPRVFTSVVAPFWAERMVRLSIRELTGGRVDTTTIRTLISLHVLFSTAGEPPAEREVMMQIFALHNRYCSERNLSSASILV